MKDDSKVSEETPILDTKKHQKFWGRKRIGIVAATVVILGVIGVVTAVIIIVENDDSDDDNETGSRQEICNDHPIIHISWDGYRADYYERMVNPNLQFVIDTGMRADYMRSQYPTQTFPNHYTIMTGLYPEYHGIVANTIYDKDLNVTFDQSNDPRFWLAEPLWITAMKNGLISAAYFWPGSDVEGQHPNYYFPYNESVSFDQRVDTALEWLDLPHNERPRIIALYFNEPDASGHWYGPDTNETNDAIKKVDESLGRLIDGLKERKILDCVNLIVTSDHGMQTTSVNKTLFIEDYVGSLTPGIHVINVGAFVQINVDSTSDRELLYAKLKEMPHTQVYYLEEIPFRLRIGHHLRNRYTDITVIPEIGWYVTMSGDTPLHGSHGWNNNAVNMRAFMAARGPAFKEGYIPNSFDNIQLYNLECALLGIPPAINNGTVGALYHLLKPSVVGKLPKEQCYKPVNPEYTENCTFPADVEDIYDELGNCSDCICPSCELNDTELVEIDLNLNLTSEQILHYQSYHIYGGIPQGGGGSGSCLLTNKDSVNKYSTALHIPLWNAYRLNKNFTLQDDELSTCLRIDPRVSLSNSAECSDYNTDDEYVADTLTIYNSSSTQYFTELVPQLSSFNQDVWQILKKMLMDWARLYSSIYVISGSIVDSNHDGMRDNDDVYDRWTADNGSVAIPTQFYSIAIRCINKSVDISVCPVDDIQAMGIVMLQEEFDEEVTDDYFKFRITSIREIEKITDTNFFPELTPSQQNNIELEILTELWEVN